MRPIKKNRGTWHVARGTFHVPPSTFHALLASTLLSGCGGMLDRLDHINKAPEMTQIVDPQEKPDYKPINWPMPENPPFDRPSMTIAGTATT